MAAFRSQDRTTPPRQSPFGGAGPAALRVLLADDHDLVRETIACFLSQNGMAEVYGVGSLDEALLAFDQMDSVDIVLLDLQMPGMDGLRGLERMLEAAKGVPVATPVCQHYAIPCYHWSYDHNIMTARRLGTVGKNADCHFGMKTAPRQDCTNKGSTPQNGKNGQPSPQRKIFMYYAQVPDLSCNPGRLTHLPTHRKINLALLTPLN